MKIKSNDLVLEIGSGDLPYYRSDILLDKFPDNSNERLGDLVVDRPLVIADAETLPFTDKSFDYIIASHVLEHVKNPAKFLEELQRVGRRGYIETPAALRERVFDWPFRRWYIYQNGKKLIFVKKTDKSKNFFAGMNAKERPNLYFLEDKKFFNIRLEWTGKITYQIIENESEEFLTKLDQKLINLLKARHRDFAYWQRIFKTRIFKIPGVARICLHLKIDLFKAPKTPKDFLARRRKNKIDLFSILACPICQGKLVVKSKKIDCSVCGRKFTFYTHRGEQFPDLS